MTDRTEEGASRPVAAKARSKRGRNGVVLAIVAAVWIAVDFLTKRAVDGAWQPGDVIGGPYAGLFKLRLVHNTGAAWGMFGDSTLALAVLSLVVCVALVVYLLALAPRANLGQAIGLALVVGGGIGNAIDRFSQGYVVDFIDLAFMDFPVFNIADIGVTCGFILFIVALLVQEHRSVREETPATSHDGQDAR